MTSWCILGFQATQLVSDRPGLILFILCLLYVGESPCESQSISEENNSGLQQNSAQFDKWLEISLPWNIIYHRKNGDLNVRESSESSEEGDECVHEAPLLMNKYGNNAKWLWSIRLNYYFLNCIFEFLLNTASQGSNNVNGRKLL